MRKIIRHLKPFALSIVLIFGLLFGQAMADLSLPAYMADIVNVGIQQSGVQNAAPRAIRVSSYDKLALFMTPDQQSAVLSDYQLLDRSQLSDAAYQSAVKDYPALANEPLYRLNKVSGAETKRLNAIFAPAEVAVSALSAIGSGNVTPGIELPVTLPQLPAGTDPFVALAGLAPAQRQELLSQFQAQLSAIPAQMESQGAIIYVIREYQAIGFDIKSLQFSYMFRIGSLMAAITLASAAASIIVGFLAARVAAGLARNLRRQLFTRVESFSNTEFDKFSTASLNTRTTNDIQQIQMLFVMLFRIVFYAPILGVGGVIRVVTTDASMWWIIAAAVGAMLTMIGMVFLFAVPKFRIIQKLVDKVNLATREMLTGLLVIRAFNTQRHEEKKFDDANVDLTRVNLFIQRVMVVLMPTMMLILNGAMILIIWVGGHRIDTGATQVGDLMAFMQYTMQIIMAFLMISFVFVMLPRAVVSIQRINEVLDTEPVIVDPDEPKAFPDDLRGQVEFRNVSFRYPNAEEDMLKNVSFTAKPGETTAIIGSTGSGKSTLINLIPRFYDVTTGEVLVDGVNVREVGQHALRDKIGYVPQKSSLFSGTIESNLRYADENAADTVLQKSIVSAQAADFILTKEHGLESPVSQGGANLSGGQKQRLSIARALVKQPEIFIFDDSFSALDFKTDSAVRRALKRDTHHATVFIVTQRLSTIMGAEHIIVLDHGEVVGLGRHKQLMETCEVYREIAQSQLSAEELAS
jgi:ATP-binding cassette subfamily B multidrug efflux pump